MIGFTILVVAVICLALGFTAGRRYGIDSEMRRQLRNRDQDY